LEPTLNMAQAEGGADVACPASSSEGQGLLAAASSPLGGGGGSEGAASPPPATLADLDPSYAARHAAHQERKASRQAKKQQGPKSMNFLSNLNEVEDDVAYRFNFTVVGAVADQVVDGVVQSSEAVRLGGGVTPSASVRQTLGHRCLCQVTAPGVEQVAGGAYARATKVAKLALEARAFGQDVPIYETRQEALSAAIVYVLTIDTCREGDPAGESDFQDQLEAFRCSVAGLRTNTRARLRPVKVVLLCCSRGSSAVPKSSLEQWAVQLADFEQENGDLWKFGPVSLESGDNLHATLAEMTSARIVHIQSGSDAAKPGEDAVDQQERDELTGGEATWSPSAGQGGRRSDGELSDRDSSVSEQERPPHFVAEASGSECSETAWELHTRIFGIAEEGTPYRPHMPLPEGAEAPDTTGNKAAPGGEAAHPGGEQQESETCVLG